jgi:hypothetical protein
VAALQVREDDQGWKPQDLQTETAHTLADAVAWLDATCRDGRIVAAGVDTLTEWNSGPSGWRLADLWLRDAYPAVRNSVVTPNSIFGSMAVNGAAFLALLAPRFQCDAAMVTEAHPKVLYYALTGTRAIWKDSASDMVEWMGSQLGATSMIGLADVSDHRFDAAMAVLAALRGLNREWTLDLHAIPGSEHRVLFCGETHYWWPG